ncbi:MAG: hypothetical protein KIS92_05435 [Planctomycetota bacterium]|nr:hypothetical protein [Planctomycetota bacterium]
MDFQPAWHEIAQERRVALFGRDGLLLFVEAWVQPGVNLWYYQLTDFFADETCYASGNAMTLAGLERQVRDQIALLFNAGFRNQYGEAAPAWAEALYSAAGPVGAHDAN